jgi:protease I
MTDMSLSGKQIAILVASGFAENQFTEAQRALVKAGGRPKTVGPDQGLVNGWHGAGWGHYFAVDALMADVLAVDLDRLVLVGGERGTTKLQSNPHTNRILRNFIEDEKPLAAMGEGIALLIPTGQLRGRTVSAPASLHEALKAAGAIVSEELMTIDDNLVTAADDTVLTDWLAAMTSVFTTAPEFMQDAA